MKYMIHTIPLREWYVDKYLIPSMLKQGIDREDITVYQDDKKDGNLKSCLKSFASLPEKGHTWHLQDDVIISSKFAQTAYEWDLPFPHDILCGFCSIYDKSDIESVNKVEDMWYSFQCIRINNKLAHEFVDWVQQQEQDEDSKYWLQINNNMFDDYLFKSFIKEVHPDDLAIYNLKPNLVDHIDTLIGGSSLYQRNELMRSMYWEEPELIEELKKKL